MPTYEYQCKSCDHTWEVDQKITAEALTDCPKCKQPEAKRLISNTSFQLLGGGWFKDGY